MAKSTTLLRAFTVSRATGHVGQPILLKRVVNGAHATNQRILTSKIFPTMAIEHIRFQWNLVVRSWRHSNLSIRVKHLGLCALFVLSALKILPGRPREKINRGTNDCFRSPNNLAIDCRWYLCCKVKELRGRPGGEDAVRWQEGEAQRLR